MLPWLERMEWCMIYRKSLGEKKTFFEIRGPRKGESCHSLARWEYGDARAQPYPILYILIERSEGKEWEKVASGLLSEKSIVACWEKSHSPRFCVSQDGWWMKWMDAWKIPGIKKRNFSLLPTVHDIKKGGNSKKAAKVEIVSLWHDKVTHTHSHSRNYYSIVSFHAWKYCEGKAEMTLKRAKK